MPQPLPRTLPEQCLDWLLDTWQHVLLRHSMAARRRRAKRAVWDHPLGGFDTPLEPGLAAMFDVDYTATHAPNDPFAMLCRAT